MHNFDVAIIGAGLGGACAALALAKRGANVAVFESAVFPRHKVCGEFLSPEIFDTFHRIGVDKLRDAPWAEVRKARIYAPQRPSNIRTSSTRCVEIALPRAGFGLSRFALDAILWQAMQSRGATTFEQTRVKNIERNDDGFQIETRDAHFSSRFVINAAGRNAHFGESRNNESRNGENQHIEYSKSQIQTPRYVGFKAHFSGVENYDGAVELHAYNGGYCGIGAIENGLTNVCCLARYETVAGRSPQDFWLWQLEQSASLRARMRNATPLFPWLATANVRFGRRAPIENGVWNCGDSAGYIHPLTGNGMAMAARSGELAAAIIARCLRGDFSTRDAETLYESAWRREFGVRLRVASQLEKLLISSRFTSSALRALQTFPFLAQRAVTQTRG